MICDLQSHDTSNEVSNPTSNLDGIGIALVGACCLFPKASTFLKMFYSQALTKVYLCKTGSKNKKNIFDI